MSEQHLIKEILEQPEVLRRIYRAYVAEENPGLREAAALLRRSRVVHMAGMVTSEFGAYQAAGLLDRAGLTPRVYDASELLYYHLPGLREADALVAISQSGESAEIVRLLEQLDGRLPVVGVVNDEDSFLARHAAIPLPIYAGPQLACGSKTNLATVAVMLLLAIAAGKGDLHAAGQHLLDVAGSLDRLNEGWERKITPLADFLEGSAYTVFLGRGPGHVAALYSAVLFKEVPKAVAEAMTAASFRHGLLEMIRPEHRVVVFALDGPTYHLAVRLAGDAAALGVPVLLVTNGRADLPASEKVLVFHLEHHDEQWAALEAMAPLQMAGALLARRKGLEPGVLQIASYVTRVE